jgi:hypothetical protein
MKKFLLLFVLLIPISVFSVPVDITIYTPDGCYIHIEGDADPTPFGTLVNFTGTIQVGGPSGCPKFKWKFRMQPNTPPEGDAVIEINSDESICEATILSFQPLHNGVDPDHNLFPKHV